MNKERAQDWGTSLGILAWIGFTTWAVLFSYGQWGAQMNAQRHRRDWAVHTGIVMKVDAPDLSDSYNSLVIPAEVSYPDFYGHRYTVNLDMPYAFESHRVASTPIAVGANGAIWAPQAADNNNQALDDPFKAHPGFWPAGAIIVIGGIGGIIVGFIVAIFLPFILMAIPKPRKPRLTKRNRPNPLWSKEELERRERDLGIGKS